MSRRRARVLVVDDAVVVRKLVTAALSEDPNIEVVGTAPNGRIGLAKMAELRPDVVTLDLEMPEMDGMSVLNALRARGSTVPVIVFSTLSERGAKATIDALAAGAADYVAKPTGTANVSAAMQRVRDELGPKVCALAGLSRGWNGPPGTVTRPIPVQGVPGSPAGAVPKTTQMMPIPIPMPMPRAERPTGAGERVDAVVIGVSTGGPKALGTLISHLPADVPAPILIVQHMPPLFTGYLAERLAQTARVKVREAAAGIMVGPGEVAIAPGDYHMVLAPGRLGPSGAVRVELHQGAARNSCRPSADELFESAATALGPRVLALVLTGMGRDGCDGSRVIRQAGGAVLAQDEATSVVWGMPGLVVREGLADEVASIDQMAGLLMRRLRAGRSASVEASR